LGQKNKKKNVRSSRRKFAFAGRSKNVKCPRPVKQMERGRVRELSRIRKLDRMLEYSTPSATVSIKNYDFISSFSRVGLHL
jgi:hypothetical protein